MKQLVLNSLIIGILAWLVSLFTPWWTCLISTAVVIFILRTKTGASLMAGFIGIGGMWAVHAAILNMEGSGIIGERMAGLMGLSSPILLIGAAALVGAVCGALGALCGKFARDLIRPASLL